MKTKTINVYNIKELSDDAKEHAHYQWLQNFDNPWASENKDTLEAFAKVFPVKIKNWSYGGNDDGVSFELMVDDNIEALTGVRLATYIWNNYGDKLFPPKYIGSLDSKPKFSPVYSKVQRERSCVLTGYCLDEDTLDPIYKFLAKPDNRNMQDLMEDCLNSWVTACSKEMEYQSSMEAFEENAEMNEYEFDEDGNLI